ncbi:hypothetical protein B0A54_05751 [Friedmanniomyces endolithicus]|uniref:Leucine-rich repeat-containing protein n=1 Tax=Friedmanniomyces endolithicus TaxID=329885 RepID=A0A4U0V3L8_9PEZI|nr:hypothetical protein B0A54_05751 [Friedmanniomyces endolithicus]
MDSEDGQVFIKRALANALQTQRTRHGTQQVTGKAASASTSSISISLTEALSRPYVKFSSQSIKPAKLTLTPHHLFYLLSKFEDLGVDVGPTTVRLENLQSDAAPSNYVSFLGHAPRSKGKHSDAASLKSVSSVRSAISSVSSLWSTLTLSNTAAKEEKRIAQHRDDVKYLYSCFTKIPALKLAPDHRARLIAGFEEFPFDTAVPLFAFKNLSALEICDLDFRQFHGWDRLSEQLRSLTVKRAYLEDPIDLLLYIVLDDMEQRRKRSSKTQQSLDLSGNLFTEIPDALASLTHLRALNMSNCMIDSLKSLTRYPLPAITTLNMRSNRLLSLIGIEKIRTLERVDLRDNKLYDPTEFRRLTAALELVDVYVAKNPFTRTHNDYRTIIFNAFRDTPGHQAELTIDTLGPSNQEKRQLRDKAPEPTPVPVIEAPPEEEQEAEVETGAELRQELSFSKQRPLSDHFPAHRRTTSDMGPHSLRQRKKGPRRRIVELSQQESLSTSALEPSLQHATEIPPHSPAETDEPTTPQPTPYHTAPTTQVQPDDAATTPRRPTLDTAFTSPTPGLRIRNVSDDDDSPVKSPQPLESHSDLYRQKIEALKHELGPNWLSALNEDRYAEQQERARNRSFSPSARIPSARPEVQTQTRGVSVGGRTLG